MVLTWLSLHVGRIRFNGMDILGGVEMDNELRVCPWCGKNPQNDALVYCHDCLAYVVVFELKKWQTGYFWKWKEIDSLRATIKLQSESHWKEHERHDKEIKEKYEAQIRVLENEIKMLKEEK